MRSNEGIESSAKLIISGYDLDTPAVLLMKNSLGHEPWPIRWLGHLLAASPPRTCSLVAAGRSLETRGMLQSLEAQVKCSFDVQISVKEGSTKELLLNPIRVF